MEPTTVGSLWLENDLHENELEFESHMGRSKKNVRVTSDGIHAEIHEIWTCVAPAAPPLCHAAVKPLSHSTAIPRRWHGDLKFLRAPWDRTKILKNIANNFTFSITWKWHGAPTATVAFPRSAHGVPPRSHGVLTGDWLRSHGALTACSWRAKSCHCASTAYTQRAQCVSTASSRSVYEHMRKQVLQAYCRNRHA